MNRPIADVLRIGTVLAVGALAAGLVLVLIDGAPEPGTRPLVELVMRGGGDALVAVGLLGLTLVPVAVVVTAAIGFGRSGDRRALWISALVLGLLLFSLAVGASLAWS